MAQSHLNWAHGEESHEIDIAADATALGTHDIRVIVKDDNIKRNDLVEGLKRVIQRVLDDEDFLPD